MLDVVFWIMARNKENAIEMAIRGAFMQTHPCRIVISDQGSTDKTREVILTLANEYKGHHTIELRHCPDTENKGHTGYNDHQNWFHKNVKYDICLACSADDVSHPDRVAKTVSAFEEHKPSMVLTAQQFADPQEDGTFPAIGESMYPEESRFVKGWEILQHLVGGSSTQAWCWDFMEEIYPLDGGTLTDVYMPFIASQSKAGCYYIKESLHTYIRWSDLKNLGAQGVLQAMTDEKEKAQMHEVVCYQIMNAYVQAALKSETLYPDCDLQDRQVLYEKIVEHGTMWANQRNQLTANRIQPIGATI